jgi:hypothetical protein
MVGARQDAHTDELKADLREAYERGRRDERTLRRRHPVLMTFLFIAAAIGAVLIGLAAAQGSFTRAGGVVDQNLATAADRAEPAVRDAAASAGQSLRDAGSGVKDKTATDQPG